MLKANSGVKKGRGRSGVLRITQELSRGSNRGGKKSTKAKISPNSPVVLQNRSPNRWQGRPPTGAPTVFGLRTPLILHVVVFKKNSLS